MQLVRAGFYVSLSYKLLCLNFYATVLYIYIDTVIWPVLLVCYCIQYIYIDTVIFI